LITKGFKDYLLGELPDPPTACPAGAARFRVGRWHRICSHTRTPLSMRVRPANHLSQN